MGPAMPYYLTPKQDDFNNIPELQICIAEALYDAEAILSNPSTFKPEEIIFSNICFIADLALLNGCPNSP